MQKLYRNKSIGAELGLVGQGLSGTGEAYHDRSIHSANIGILMDAVTRDKMIWDRVNLSFTEQTHQRQKPQLFYRLQLELLKYLNGKTIVEVGSARAKLRHPITGFNPVCCNDGHSTYHWSSNASFEVYTVDIDPRSKINLEKAGFRNLHAFTADGISFLRNWGGPSIDFLFLDAWDVGVPEYAEKHLEAFQVIQHKLSPKHIIGIDDTDFAGDGKGKYLVPYLKSSGYTMIADGRQTIFINFVVH